MCGPRLWRRERGWLPVQRFCSQFGQVNGLGCERLGSVKKGE